MSDADRAESQKNIAHSATKNSDCETMTTETTTIDSTDTEDLRFDNGDRIAYVEGEIEMTVNIIGGSLWFSEETSPVGIELGASHDSKNTTWLVGGGNRRPPARSQLDALYRSGWRKVESND